MGNVAEYCGNERIHIDPFDETIPILFPPRGIEPVVLKDGQKTVINPDNNNILFLPLNNKIINNVRTMNQVDNAKPVHIDQIIEQVSIIESIESEGQRMKAIHYVMKANQLSDEQVKEQTNQVKQLILNRSQNEREVFTPESFKEVNDALKSVGIEMDWTHKRGVESALSIHVLSGLSGNMVRCQFKEADEERKYENLIQNKALLNQHYQDIKLKIANKFEIEPDKITIVEINKGSVKTTFVVNLTHITDKMKGKKITLSSKQNLTIHPYFEKFKLSPEDFDPHGNNDYTKIQGLSKQEQFRNLQSQRGGLIYKKPLTCKRYGLNVWDRYDGGNNDWLDYKNLNEWAIAYHGVNSPGSKSTFFDPEVPETKRPYVISAIMTERLLKAGSRDLYGGEKCLTPGHKPNCNAPKLPNNGIYLTPDIEVALDYASPTQIGQKKRYRLAFQCRVHPKYVHIVKGPVTDNYWIAQSSNYIRPYAIILRQQR